jgi:quercetin dioxygenase-like cupin family protein
MKYKKSSDSELIVKQDYSKRIIFSLDDFSQSGHLLQTVTIPPNTKQRIHHHIKQTEVFYILKGEAILTINENDYLAQPRDAFICSPGDKHNLWNKSDNDFELLVLKINMDSASEDTQWSE